VFAHSLQQSNGRRFARVMTAAVLLAGSLSVAGPAVAEATTSPDPIPSKMRSIVGVDKYPGALAAVRDKRGRTKHYTAGAGDLRTGAPVPVNGRVRVGSTSKMFAAVVLLQLAEAGDVNLNASVESYLPGLVRSKGVDPGKITVRQLLQHDSGIPDYTDVMFKVMGDLVKYQHIYLEPRQLVDLANTEEGGPAGRGWAYSNTNYVLAGLIAQRVTGRPFNELVTERVIKRAGLRDTYVPGVGEKRIRGRHPKGYQFDPGTGKLLDFTQMDPSWGWAAGQLISTPEDINTFLRALLVGDLLTPRMLAEMRHTIPTPTPGQRYGLGLFSLSLSCGGVAWGHGGDIPGYSNINAATDDGRGVTLVVTSLDGSINDPSGREKRNDLVDAALCAKA
jgi:D-alanyl-D-alanine carboxypeptidase